MYNNVSEEFKQVVKSRVITSTAKMTFPELDNLVIDGSLLQDCTITDYCYNNGQLIGTTMCKEADIKLNNKNNYKLQDKEFKLEVGVQLSNGEYEYIPYGNYIVKTYEDTKSNNIYKIIAYDYMDKLNGKFEDNKNFEPIFPITAKNFYIQFLESYGIQCEEQSLPNQLFMINSMPGFEGMTGRTVLGCLSELFAGFAKINRENKCQIYLKTETNENFDASTMNTSLIVNERYGPVNVVTIGLSNIEGENVTYQNKESIAEYGETTIKILDNPILYTEDLREKAIMEIYNALNGFQYIPTEFKGKSLLYTDCGDMVQVLDVNSNQYVNTILLNQTINIPKTRSGQYSNLALSNTATENKYISKTKQANTKTEIMVDKQNQIIESVVSNVTEQNNKISKVQQTVDSLNSKISDIADITTSQESNSGILEFNNINQSEPIHIEIKPLGESISYLHPFNTLFPSDDLFTTLRTLRFTNTKTNEIFDYILPDDLLYYNSENYDIFIMDYDSQTCYINKKCVRNNNTGEITTLEQEIVEEYEFEHINLTDGDYKIEILKYDNKPWTSYLFARLMSQNIYTTQFATKSEVKSEINQTTQSIDLSVNKKLENYSTTTEMNSAIKLTADGINLEVRKKVGEDELITQINQSEEEIKLKGNRFVVESNNFKLDKYGNMTANNANLTGEFKLTSNITGYDALKIVNQSIYFYDWTSGGQLLGKLESVHKIDSSLGGIMLYCENGKYVSLGVNNGDDIFNAFQINNDVIYGHTPYIRNTADGVLFKDAGGVIIENGLIKDWNMSGVTEKLTLMDASGAYKVIISVKSGLIVGWDVQKL